LDSPRGLHPAERLSAVHQGIAQEWRPQAVPPQSRQGCQRTDGGN